MRTDAFPIKVVATDVDRVVAGVHQFLNDEKGIDVDPATVKQALIDWSERKAAAVWEDAEQLLTEAHHGEEISEFLEIVRSRATKQAPSINGHREFDFEKLTAMIEHLAHKGRDLKPTRLNKLLFYADFSHFHHTEQSISGAVYTKLTHGPILDGYRNVIDTLEKEGRIRITRFQTKGKEAQIIHPSKNYRPEESVLTEAERNLLDWVIETYDHLSTPDLIATSHRETGYWDAHFGQPIDYKYSKDLEHLPPPDLFE